MKKLFRDSRNRFLLSTRLLLLPSIAAALFVTFLFVGFGKWAAGVKGIATVPSQKLAKVFRSLGKPATVRMATLTVINGNDSGAGSLRQAISDAAANDTINFQAGVTTVTLTTATLDINKVLTIDGGTSGVTITRGAGSPVFRIFLVTADLTLNKLTVTNGDSSPGTSSSVSGGAIRVTAGALTLTNCTFSGNFSSNSGGAVDVASTAGALTVNDCTFTNNTCGGGGAAMNIFGAGPNSISASTFNLNTATGSAGALNIGAAATVTNCTFNGNSSAGTGGAINTSATSTFTNVTVVGNTTSQASANVAGGIRTGTSTFTYTFNNCLIAGNTTPNSTNGSTTVQLSNTTSGMTTSVMTGSNNVIGDNTSIVNSPNMANGVNNNLIGTVGSPLSPMVNALANNGGPTQTMSLQAGSPSINRATSGAPATDQRGYNRPNTADAGAFELGGTAPVAMAPEIDVTETGVGNIADGGSFSFGTTTVGAAVTKTFTVTNSGNANLTLSNLSVPSGFSIASNFGSATVTGSGGTTTFQITMTAAASGTPSGTLTFDNNDADENPFNFTISGTVNKANTTTTINNAVALGTSSAVGQAYPVQASVTSGGGTPTGTITVSDGTDTCTITLPATSCNLTSTSRGAKTITATYNGDTNFNSSTSAGVSHSVFAPPTISKFFVNPAQGNSNNTSLNGTARLAIAITNPPGNPGSLSGLAITDNFPAGLEVDSSVVTSNTCGGTFAPTAGATSISLSGGGPLTVANQCSIFVMVKATTAGAIVNTTGNVSSTEGGAGLTASGTLNVFAPPTISKAFSPGSIFVNGTFSQLTFTIANPNASGTLTGVGFSDALPGGLEVASTPGLVVTSCGGSTNTSSFTTGATTLNVSNAAVTAGTNCTIRVNVIGTTAGAKNNTTGPITSTQGGTGTTSNTATLNVFTAPQITKSFGASTIPVGGTTTVTFTITNPAANPGTLSTITFIDSLPAGMVVVNPPIPTNTCSGSVTAVNNSGTISLGGASIATPGNSCQVQATVMATTAGVKTNNVTVSSGNGGTGNTATASVAVANPPTLTKAFSPSLITPNGTSTLTVTLSNSNSIPLTGATLTDTLPVGVTTIISTAATTCGGTVSQTSGAVSLSGGTIPASGSCTLTVNVTSATNGSYINTIAVGALTTADSGPNATPATAPLLVGSAPAITKTFTPNAIKTGATSTMTISITNNNASLPFNGVGYTDTLPAGLTVPDAAAPACGGTLTVASNVITLTGATIAAGGGTCTTTFTVTGATVGVKNNTVTVNTTNFGTGYTGMGTITVYDVPTIAKAFSPTSVPFGGTSILTFTLTNPNSFSGGNLSGLSFTDTLPAGITIASNSTFTICGGTFTQTVPSTISFSGGMLGASNFCTINVLVAGSQIGTHTNTVSSLTSTQTGTNTVNAQAALTVTASPATTTITNAASLASTPTVVGQPYAVNVTVAPAMGGMGIPTGTVNVSDGTGATCVITLSGGSGTCNLTSTTPGAKTITASYQGDTNFATSSTTASHTVNKANTTLSNVTDSPDPSVVGQPYTVGFTLSVNLPGAGTPTGMVTVNDGTGGTCTAMLPTTSCTLTSISAGGKTLTFTYSGDANFNASTATDGHQVNKASTTTTITAHTPDPSVIGQNYAVTASVTVNSSGSGTPTGTITVTDGTNNCTITLPATSCNLPGTSVGAKTLTATYNGDANYNASLPSAGVSHTVNKADTVTTITSDNPDSSAVGQNVTVAFTVSASGQGAGTPTGNVTITVSGGSETCTGALAAGSGSCTLALTTAGSRTLTANYNGDANFNTSTDTEPHTVVAPPSIAKAFNPSRVPVGQTSTLTFTITNPAANTVALTGVGFTDTFPNAPNLIVANPTGATLTGCSGATLTDNLGGALAAGDLGVRLSGATVGVGGTCTVTVNVAPQAQGPFVNTTGNVSSTNGGTGNTATDTLLTNTPPMITPVAISRAAGSPGSNSTIATVSDNETAAGSLIVTITSANPSNGVTLSNLLNTNGTITADAVATCSATSASFTLQVSDGNLTSTGTLNVMVTPDNIPPIIAACPANITTSTASGQCAANVTFTVPTASDNCTGAIVTCVPASGASFAKGVTTVTCTSRDAANNTGTSCTFTVTVNDTQAPTIVACPANLSLPAASGQCSAVATFTLPTASDNCTGATVACSPASGTTFTVGTTTVTCTPTDASNNVGTACTFTVTINDTQAPTITCPANIFLASSGNPVVATWNPPTVSDNCSGTGTPVCSPASGSSFNVGVTTVTCSVADAANNSASCSFTVAVNRVTGSISDPLACTGPGSTVSAKLVISNNGNVNQTVADTTTFTNLVGVPGSCTVSPNVGTCVVTNGNLTYNATLTPGQTVTISYLTQVSDLAPTGAQVCTNNSVSFNGGAPLTLTVCDVVDCPAAGPGNLIPAASEASDQKAGSVLIYNVYTSGVTNANTQNTRINITNTHLTLSSFIHLFFVAEGCAIADSYICLTGNQTASFLASDLDPVTTGYLVAVAVNNLGCPTNFNYLIGDEYVKFTSGHAANLAAEAFAALPGGLPACDANANTATINFDGVSYNRTPATLSLDSVGARADGNDTLLIVNRIGGNLGIGASSLGTLFGLLYDDTEASVSFSVTGGCQLRGSLTNNFPRTTPRFETFIPAGRTGWLKIFNQTGAIGITGAAINFNPNASSSAGAFNQGHNLHHLTLNNSMSYVIPVFPPSC